MYVIQPFSSFCLVSEEITTKVVNGLKAGLTRIRNELKHHEIPACPDDKFGTKMNVSFHWAKNLIVVCDVIMYDEYIIV